MNKLLSKIAVAFVGMSMAIGVGFAVGSGKRSFSKISADTTVTFTVNVETGSTSLEKDGVSVSTTSGTFSRTDNYRVYANNSMTISATSNITSVVFTISQNTFTASPGTWTENTKTWTGSATSITFSASGGQVRFTTFTVTLDGGSSSNPRGTVAITGPSSSTLNPGNTGDLSYSWTPSGDAPSVTVSTATWSSDDTSVLTVDNSLHKYSALKKGSATLSLSVTDSSGEEYSLQKAITVENPALVLPEMPNGDYVKVTSSQDDYTGYYLIVYEDASVAWKGGLSSLDVVSNGIDVTITDRLIENSSSSKSETINQHAFYIDKVGSSYRIACNINESKLRYIGRTADSNGLNSDQADNYVNEVGFANSAMYVKSADVTRYIGFNTANDQQRFRYLSSANVAFYKKTTAVDTLRSIAIVSPTTTFKDGDNFSFGGSVTATYSISGTEGHTGITSGLTFEIGGETVTNSTVLTRGEYEVTVTYNDGITSKSNTYNIVVGYHDAESVTITGAAEITVAKGYTGSFTATVNPSNAQNSVAWSVTDTSGNATALATINSSTGAFEALNSGDVKVIATSLDGHASSYVLVHITGDPVLTLDKTALTLYKNVDTTTTLTATPSLFPEGEKTYEWSSSVPGVVTVSNSTTNTETITVAGVGSSTITVIGKVGGTEKARTTCVVTVVKSRSVVEQTTLEGAYDFSSLAYVSGAMSSSTSIDNSYSANGLTKPTCAVGDYVYQGNASGGAYNTAGGTNSGYLKFGTSSNGGTLTFTFANDVNITKVEILSQTWTSDSGDTISVNSTAAAGIGTSTWGTASRTANLGNEIIITTNKRVFIKEIHFYSALDPQQIGRTADVVGLETFIDTYMHMDYDQGGTIGSTTGNGSCTGFYYGDNNNGAKAAFNGLNAHQRELFTENSAYTTEWNRLREWARVNGDSLNGNNQLASARVNYGLVGVGEVNTVTTIIILASMAGIAAVGGYFFIKKRKENY